MVHLYYGEGKGKTTAATGLALRALGAGWRVTLVAFLKDGSSAELAPLRALGARVYAGQPEELAGVFSWRMSAAQKTLCRRHQTAVLQAALQAPCDLLVLDEACAAWRLDLVDRDLLRTAVEQGGRELVLTGRDPAPWMLSAADYATECRAERHPFRQGTPARRGIEF